MKFKFFVIILAFLFFNCLSYNNDGTLAAQSKSKNSSSKNKNSNISAYVLSEGENLSTFLQTQNKLNEYASHENIPTESEYKELFTEYIDIINENMDEFLEVIKMTDEEKKELETEYNLTYDDFVDFFKRIGFMYKIEYNKASKIWSIILIGRSTTLQIEMSHQRGRNMSYSHSVIPHVNSWMELNNVSDLDDIFRIYINEIKDTVTPELFGESLDEF